MTTTKFPSESHAIMSYICCVIGGTGFVGSYVVRLLSKQGRKVKVIGRSSEPIRKLPDNVEYYVGDYGNRGFLETVLRDVDDVIALAHATVPKTSFDDPVSDILRNLPAAVTLFETAAAKPLHRLLFVSSGGTVYGNSERFPIKEEFPTRPISPYGITKLAIEKYAFMYHATRCLPFICVRPSNAYGPGQFPFVGQGLVATTAASIIKAREILSYGDSVVRDYTHVSDMANGILAALDRGKVGECYNIGSGFGRSNREVIDNLISCSQKEGYQPVVKVLSAREFDVSANILNSEKLTLETGWRPEISFEEGIVDTWRWYTGNLK